MTHHVGTAETVQQLIDLLETLPPDKPVRSRSLSHEFPPEVREHERCVTVDCG